MQHITEKEFYDAQWDTWVDMKIYGPASRWLRTLIFDLIKIINKKKYEVNTVIDVGCGEGTNTFYIAKYFAKANIKGIDFSETAIKCAKLNYKLPNLEFIHDINSINLNLNYDLLCCFEVLEHVEDWKILLKRMANSSQKLLLLSFPTGRMRKFESNVGHIRNFQKGEVENFLYKLNYKPIKIFYAGFPFYSPIYREFCNLTNAGNNSFTNGSKYGISQKLISSIIYFMFKTLSTKNKMGDQFCGLFVKST